MYTHCYIPVSNRKQCRADDSSRRIARGCTTSISLSDSLFIFDINYNSLCFVHLFLHTCLDSVTSGGCTISFSYIFNFYCKLIDKSYAKT